ncbi:MAG: SCO family protein [Pyrobaculum sp.]
MRRSAAELKYILLITAVFAALLLFPVYSSLFVNNSSAAGGLGQASRITVECYEPGAEPTAQDFILVNQFNKTVALSQLWETPTLLIFAYTYCPDVCPIINLVLNATRPKLPGVIIAEITLDPERDTPQRLYAYSVGNKYNWTFLTGPREVLEKVWRSYGVIIERRGDYIAHNVLFIVIHKGNILGVIKGLSPPEDLAKNVERILRRCR